MKDKKMMEERKEEAKVFASKINEKLGDKALPSEYVRTMFQELYEGGVLGEDRDEALSKFMTGQKRALDEAIALAGVALKVKEDEIPDMVVEAFKRMLECAIMFSAGLDMIDEECEKETSNNDD